MRFEHKHPDCKGWWATYGGCSAGQGFVAWIQFHKIFVERHGTMVKRNGKVVERHGVVV